MAHGPDCEDFDIREAVDPLRWMPQGTPADVDLTTLPAPGAITKPIRLPGARAPWVGVWGSFAGLRIGTSAGGPTWPVDKGTTFVYPGGDLDLFASADTGAWGKATLGRFWKREYAVAWAGVGSLLRSGSGAPLGPFPAATALAANEGLEANPTTTRVGALALIADVANNEWSPMRGIDPTADGRALPLNSVLWAQSPTFNDRTGLFDRLRQPNATAPKSVLQSSISLASTGVKATRTMAQDGWIIAATVMPNTGTPTNAIIVLQIVRSATTFGIGSAAALAATLNQSANLLAADGTRPSSPLVRVPVIAGDVVQLNVLTASAAATADFQIGFEENRFVQ